VQKDTGIQLTHFGGNTEKIMGDFNMLTVETNVFGKVTINFASGFATTSSYFQMKYLV
jgi:hypothetical protein